MFKFNEGVIKIVKMIPAGKVASYGQVAVYLGLPRAARQVGWVLNRLPDDRDVPWWRVVNNSGRISIKASKYSAWDQKLLLENEGIKINNDLRLVINEYRFIPDDGFINSLKLDDEYIAIISTKLPYSRYF